MKKITEYKKNPRKITNKRLSALEITMDELGDISGITHDITTNEIISGNQRCKVVDINKAEIVLTEEYDKPDKQGTIAWGYVVWKGSKFNYRRVKWNDKTREKANIVANAAGGEWDYNILSNDFEESNLLEYGMILDRKKLSQVLGKNDDMEIDNMECQLYEHHDYIVLLFENMHDYLYAINKFEIKKVSFGLSEKHKKIGIGRVISGRKVLSKLFPDDFA